jgi:DNA-binding NtrC family response regulator
VLLASDLDETAGLELQPEDGERGAAAAAKGAASEATEVEAALSAERGNVVRAAARLGVSRARLRRLIDRLGIDMDALRRG